MPHLSTLPVLRSLHWSPALVVRETFNRFLLSYLAKLCTSVFQPDYLAHSFKISPVTSAVSFDNLIHLISVIHILKFFAISNSNKV